MTVPPPAWPISDVQIEQVFAELLQTGAWGKYHAEHTHRLIEMLQEQYQVEHAVLTSSGTAAVELALRGLNIQAGDEVILAAYDFKANFTNVTLLGAVPVLVDIRPENAQLDVALVEAAITEKTRAILISHLHGGLVDVVQLQVLAQQHGLHLIEDCCQISCQAKIGTVTAGSVGDVAVLSFGGSKLLSAGRGGAILTSRDDIAQRIRLYNQRGNEAYPLSEMQAAILLPQLKQIASRQEFRAQAVADIRAGLQQDSGVRLFELPNIETSDYYKLGMWYEPDVFSGLSRKTFCRAMRAEGIPLDPGFAALHQIHSSRRFRASGTFTHADHAHALLVVLHHPFLLRKDSAAQHFLEALDKLRQHATILRSLP